MLAIYEKYVMILPTIENGYINNEQKKESRL